MKLTEFLYNIRKENFYKKLSYFDMREKYGNIKCVNCGYKFKEGRHGDATGVCFEKYKDCFGDRSIPFCYKPEINL